MSKKVIITGVSGMDGSHMVDYLLENTDYEIYGVVRRLSIPNYRTNLASALENPRFKLVTADLSDAHSIDKIIAKIKPDYFINLAAQSFVAASWEVPEQTLDVNSNGVMRCLESILRHAPNCRFYNAGSSEEFGDVQYSPQDEKHPLRARSPYGASKISARQIVKTYRESYGLYAIQGYLFNHEGERRGEEFVTRKITKGVGRIKRTIGIIKAQQALNNEVNWAIEFKPIELGNLDAKRDWSYSPDFVDGIWKMLNQNIYRTDILFCDTNPKTIKEYVLSSNETHTIREFIELAFKEAGFDNCMWEGEGVNEVYRYKDANGQTYQLVRINPEFYRPAEVALLLGDSTLAREELGWSPKCNFQQLVAKMVKNDIENCG